MILFYCCYYSFFFSFDFWKSELGVGRFELAGWEFFGVHSFFYQTRDDVLFFFFFC